MEASNFSASNVSHFTPIDYSVFGLLLLCSTSIGLYFGFFSKSGQTTEEYLHGGHKMQTFPIGVSLVTSMISALSVVAIPTEVYSFGWLCAFPYPLTILLLIMSANYLFLPVYHQCGIDNCYVYLEMRFSRSIRYFTTISWLLHVVLFIPIALYLPSLAFAEVTGHSIHTVNTIACYCCVIYTMLGGMKAVVWTDVVQGAVMMLAMTLVISFGLREIGSISLVWNRAVDGGRVFVPDFAAMDLTTRNTFWNMLLESFIVCTSFICFDQSVVQRVLSLPSLSHAKRSVFVYGIGVVSIKAFNFFTGIIMFAYYYGCDPVQAQIVDRADKILPRFVQDVVGHISGMPGVFISCVFSASLSTVSAFLNTIAGILYMDFIRPLNIIRHTEATANRLMKLIVFLVGSLFVLGVWVIEKIPSSFHALKMVEGMTVGTTFGVFTLGMLYPWANKHGALYGVLISMATMCFIVTNTQMAIESGTLRYVPLPTSVDQCDNKNFNTSVQSKFTHQTDRTGSKLALDDGFALYKISFMWYCPLGVLFTWIFGIIISYFTGGQDLAQLDLNLLSPAIKSLLPAKYQHTQLQMDETIAKETDKVQDGNDDNDHIEKFIDSDT